MIRKVLHAMMSRKMSSLRARQLHHHRSRTAPRPGRVSVPKGKERAPAKVTAKAESDSLAKVAETLDVFSFIKAESKYAVVN